MRALRTLIAVACCATLLAVASAGDDGPAPAAPPPATKRWESADHLVGLELPADWRVSPAPPDEAVITLRAEAPSAGGLFVEVFCVPGIRDPRTQMYLERAVQPVRYGVKGPAEASLEPMPHLVLDSPNPGHYPRKAWIYRVLGRCGYTLTVFCDVATWPKVKDACFAAAASLTSVAPEWPAPPEGYKASERDGYEYYVQPGVKADEVASLHAALLEQEKRYAKLHGPVPKPAGSRPIVVMSTDAASHKAAGATSGDPYSTSLFEARLFAVPLRRDDSILRSNFASAAAQLFHGQRHGMGASWWMCVGEARLASEEAYLGRALPWASETFLSTATPAVVGRFDDLVRAGAGADVAQATAYVALLRAGPLVWRDAYAAFLKDLAATGDWEAAEKTRLLSLDQEKFRAAAQAFLKELRPVKAK